MFNSDSYHRAVNELYISGLIDFYKPSRSGSGNKNLAEKKVFEIMGVSAHRLWNSLAQLPFHDIRACYSVTSFKTALKTHPMDLA